MKIKDGVYLQGLQLPMRQVLIEASRIWERYGQELVVTSGLEGTHSPSSLHYYGYALDFRSRYFDDLQRFSVGLDLRSALGDKYFVLVEDDHIHVEYKEILK